MNKYVLYTVSGILLGFSFLVMFYARQLSSGLSNNILIAVVLSAALSLMFFMTALALIMFIFLRELIDKKVEK